MSRNLETAPAHVQQAALIIRSEGLFYATNLFVWEDNYV
jgi:hypothetical protein